MADDEWVPILRVAGRNVRAERARREWTQEGLASSAGMGVSQLARMERGELDAGITKYIRIARALGVPLPILFEGVE